MNADEQWTESDALRWRSYVIDAIAYRGLDQKQAAKTLGLSPSTMTNWCRDGKRPTLDNAELFGRLIGNSAEDARLHAGYSATAASAAMIDELTDRISDRLSGKIAEEIIRKLGEDARPLRQAIKERRKKADPKGLAPRTDIPPM
jgi:transcriptional regulator with XRE-family HTH domain